MKQSLSFLLMLFIPVFLILAGGDSARSADQPSIRSSKPLPSNVSETTGLGIYSVVELKDGSLLGNNGRISQDGGKTWSEPRPLVEQATTAGSGAVGAGLLRLKSGGIALTAGNRLWISQDEGKTWSGPVEVMPKMLHAPYYLGDEMIQLDGGRLLLPTYFSFHGDEHTGMKRSDVAAYGYWRGQRHGTESHHHVPEIYVTKMSYSDDEGTTWNVRPSALMGWFDEEGKPTGYGGVTGVGEATVAETKDGRVLLFSRSQVNRIVYTYSSDQGVTWDPVLPTELANSGSPARLRRIPKTGDLMVVWNQVSREEIQRGYRRGRLSVAISKDSGSTWENFKTLELSEGLEDVPRIAPENPIKMTRARDFVGALPDGFMYFHYANVSFAGDQVFLFYSRGGPLLGVAEEKLNKQEHVLRIYPLEYFYK